MSESPADWISAALTMALAIAFVIACSRED
jgi:hypothetical protein